MQRRSFLAGLASVVAAPLTSQAQQAGKLYRLGFLVHGPLGSRILDALRAGLRDFGYIEGRNLVIEARSANQKPERYIDLISEFAKLKVDVIVALGTQAARGAKQNTSAIPVVMALVGDPVQVGIVASVAHPGGNVTGRSLATPEMFVKGFEILKEAVPSATRIARLEDPTNPAQAIENYSAEGRATLDSALKTLGFKLQRISVTAPTDFHASVAKARGARADALWVSTLHLDGVGAKKLADLAVKNRLPTATNNTSYVDDGGLLLCYTPNFFEEVRRVGPFVDKIFKGAKPADLPVEQPTRFELVINRASRES